MANLTIGIEVTITDKQQEALLAMAPGLSRSEALSGLATSALQDLAGGGTMLTPKAVLSLSRSLRDPFDEREIITMVEKGAKRFGNAELVEFALDPIYVTPMQDHAKSNGLTMQALVQDCMTIAFEQGWFYEIPPHKTLALTEAQYERIRQALGKDSDDTMFGADVAEFIEQAATAPVA